MREFAFGVRCDVALSRDAGSGVAELIRDGSRNFTRE